MPSSARLFALSSLLVACATSPVRPEGARDVILSIQNLECVDCAPELVELVRRQPGVSAATFDTKALELHLVLAPGGDEARVIAALESTPFDGRQLRALPGPGQGHFAAFEPETPGTDVQLLSPAGEDVPELAKHAAPGKVTLFDFYADWCGPCHELDRAIHERLRADPKLAYRRLNVVDWDSPLAKRYLAGASELPFVIVYDASGREVARFAGFDAAKLEAALARAGSR